MWCVAELDEAYVAKMEDVLAVYEKPYSASEPVLCLDEKPVSLHAEVRSPRPAKPGQPAKRDNEYKRCGTANIFCAVEPKAGRHFAWATPNRTARQFAYVIRDLVTAYPFARTIHLVLDNLNIHCRKSMTDHLGQKEGAYLWSRLTIHHTPKHGSWLNQAEIELSLLSRQCLGKRRIPELNVLRQETKCWVRKVNAQKIRIQWRFTRKDAQRRFGYDKHSFTRSKY